MLWQQEETASATPTQSSPYVDKGGQEDNATIKSWLTLGMKSVKGVVVN